MSEQDRSVIAENGMGRESGIGARPALLVVDITHDFTGDRPEPVLESIKRFPLSCGEVAWQALPRIRELIDTARGAGVPVIYTRQAPRRTIAGAGAWARKNARVLDTTEDSRRIGNEIPAIIAPRPDEILIEKDKPSAFFGTALISYLNAMGVDSLVIAGTSTSGCVRATAVDAFSLNYPVLVVEDCVFDRVEISHKVSLFDLHAKYADVAPLETVKPLIAGLASDRGELVAVGARG